MTFEQLKEANKSINTTPIKGKEYAEVNQRIKVFRMLYPDGDIETELLSDENGVCKFKAVIYDENGKKLATGHAYEKESSSFINKTSYIENCETSAVGRALGMLGIGIDTSVASYEEVQNAITNQNKDDSKNKAVTEEAKASVIDEAKVKTLEAMIKQKGVYRNSVLQKYGKTELEQLTVEEFMNAMNILNNMADRKK